jgi:hypothetical protein
MLPSPSLGPPWLSLSPSPAFAPCGIPDELEPPDVELELELDEVEAGAEELDELEAGADEELEEDEPPPQPATAMAATASARATHRRDVIQLRVIDVPLFVVVTGAGSDPRGDA